MQVVEGGIVVRILGVTGRASRGFIPAGHTGTPRGTDLRKEFKLGAQLDVKVLEIDRSGKIRLSRKEALSETGADVESAQPQGGQSK